MVTIGKCFLKACACVTPVIERSADAVVLTHRLLLVNSESNPTLECLCARVPETVLQSNRIVLLLSGLVSCHLAKFDGHFVLLLDGTFLQNTELFDIPYFIIYCVF